MSTALPNLGLASTEMLFRELIERFTVGGSGLSTQYASMHRVAVLAEMLGGLDAAEREYRTADR